MRENVVITGQWFDSLTHRPCYQEEIWVCNGEGGPVSPARYVGADSGRYHGLFGATPDLRDDHYYWMIRHPVAPPATKAPPPPRVIFVAEEQDHWVDSRNAVPDNDEVVWIDDLVVGPQVAKFEGIDRPPLHVRTGRGHISNFDAYPPIFRSMDGSHKYVGHRYWAPITSPKRPLV